MVTVRVVIKVKVRATVRLRVDIRARLFDQGHPKLVGGRAVVKRVWTGGKEVEALVVAPFL